MNLEETGQLLAFISRCDNRRVDDATAFAWQSVIGDMPYPDCLAAARKHFATSAEYLMPVHVRRLAIAIRDDRTRKPHEIRAVPSSFEDDEDRAERLRRGVALARALTAFAGKKSIPEEPKTESDRLRQVALEVAFAQRGRAKSLPRRRGQGPALKDEPPPATADVAALALRYLRDGYDPAEVSRRLGVSKRWCRTTAKSAYTALTEETP